MNGLTNISREGKWTDSVSDLNGNFIALNLNLGAIETDIQKCKGLFPSLDKLRTDFPNPEVGSWAYVGTVYLLPSLCLSIFWGMDKYRKDWRRYVESKKLCQLYSFE